MTKDKMLSALQKKKIEERGTKSPFFIGVCNNTSIPAWAI